MSVIRHTLRDWDHHFLEIAKLCSQMSKDPSTKVGAAIMGPDKSVVSTGYNGFPAGILDNKELLNNREEKYKYVIHAEENALRFAYRYMKDLNNCTIYTTLFPCDECYKKIRDSGIRRVVTRVPSEEHKIRWGDKWEKVKEMAEKDGIMIECLEIS